VHSDKSVTIVVPLQKFLWEVSSIR